MLRRWIQMIFNLIKTAKQLFINRSKTGVAADNVEDAISVLNSNLNNKANSEHNHSWLSNISGDDTVRLQNDNGVINIWKYINNNWVLADSFYPKTEVNNLLASKQNNLAKGTFEGNIDTDVASNSIVWCNSAITKGTLPTEGYFQLHNFSSSDGLHYQMAVFFNNGNAPMIYSRLYCNSAWSGWVQIQDKIPNSISFWDNGIHITYNDGGYAIQNDNRMWRLHANGEYAWLHEFNVAGDTVLNEYTFKDGNFHVTGDLIDGKGNQLSALTYAENITVTTTSDWYIIAEKSDYYLANAYTVRDDSSFSVKGINKRPAGGYTLVFDGITSNVQVQLYLVWVKKTNS